MQLKTVIKYILCLGKKKKKKPRELGTVIANFLKYNFGGVELKS